MVREHTKGLMVTSAISLTKYKIIHNIKQYNSTIRGNYSARRQKCHLKKHNKNHLYRIVVVHLTSNVAFKTTKHF